MAGDADINLELQLAFTAVFNIIGYDLVVDYSKPPEVPLPPEAGSWAEARVRDWLKGS